MTNLQAPQTHTPNPQGQPPYGQPQGQYAPQYGPQSGQQYGQPYGPAQPMTSAEAAAHAKAARAQAKRLRPWFKKKRFVAPLSLVALITVVNLASGGDSTTTATPAATPSAPAASQAASKPAAKSAAKPATTADPKSAEATRATKPAAKSADTAAQATIGTAVTSGDFKVTITRVRTGVKSVGNEFLGEKAQGRYVLVDLKATNSGDEAHYLLGSDLKLLDARGREFSVDEMASLYVSDSNPLLEEINPGNTSKGTLVFDLPKGVKATQAQISAGGLFDGPTVVQLTR